MSLRDSNFLFQKLLIEASSVKDNMERLSKKVEKLKNSRNNESHFSRNPSAFNKKSHEISSPLHYSNELLKTRDQVIRDIDNFAESLLARSKKLKEICLGDSRNQSLILKPTTKLKHNSVDNVLEHTSSHQSTLELDIELLKLKLEQQQQKQILEDSLIQEKNENKSEQVFSKKDEEKTDQKENKIKPENVQDNVEKQKEKKMKVNSASDLTTTETFAGKDWIMSDNIQSILMTEEDSIFQTSVPLHITQEQNSFGSELKNTFKSNQLESSVKKPEKAKFEDQNEKLNNVMNDNTQAPIKHEENKKLEEVVNDNIRKSIENKGSKSPNLKEPTEPLPLNPEADKPIPETIPHDKKVSFNRRKISEALKENKKNLFERQKNISRKNTQGFSKRESQQSKIMTMKTKKEEKRNNMKTEKQKPPNKGKTYDLENIDSMNKSCSETEKTQEEFDNCVENKQALVPYEEDTLKPTLIYIQKNNMLFDEAYFDSIEIFAPENDENSKCHLKNPTKPKQTLNSKSTNLFAAAPTKDNNQSKFPYASFEDCWNNFGCKLTKQDDSSDHCINPCVEVPTCKSIQEKPVECKESLEAGFLILSDLHPLGKFIRITNTSEDQPQDLGNFFITQTCRDRMNRESEMSFYKLPKWANLPPKESLKVWSCCFDPDVHKIPRDLVAFDVCRWCAQSDIVTKLHDTNFKVLSTLQGFTMENLSRLSKIKYRNLDVS